ncbi:MAG: 50S ribosomal protein L11 methyltransferase [bacterium]
MPPGKEESYIDPNDSGPAPAGHYWELEADLDLADEELWSLFCHEKGAAGAEVMEEGDSRITIRHFFNTPPEGFGEFENWAASKETLPFSEAMLEAFSGRYPAATPPHRIVFRVRPVEPWETAWRVHFKPLAIGRRLLITPPWESLQPSRYGESPQGGHRLRVVIDPGMGFGTGGHASTRLGLMLLEDLLLDAPMEHLPQRMLDVGTGSGILAIAAALLAGARVTAVDIDEDALPEVRRNFRLSGLTGPEWLLRGAPGCLRGSYPLVTANITAPVLLNLRDSLLRLTAPGGYLIVSGVLESELESFLPSFLAPTGNFSVQLDVEKRHEGWWGCRIQRGSSDH